MGLAVALRAQERARQGQAVVARPAELFVTDRGQRVPLDMGALQQLVEAACADLGKDVVAEPILAETRRNLYDGVPLDEVYKALILAARTLLEKEPDETVVLLDLSHVIYMDTTAFTTLEALHDRLAARNHTLVLYGAPPQVNTDLGEPRRKFASDAYHAFWEEKYAEAFAGKPMRFETDLVDRSGRRVCNEIFLSPVFDAEGRVSEVFGIGHEITEQK